MVDPARLPSRRPAPSGPPIPRVPALDAYGRRRRRPDGRKRVVVGFAGGGGSSIAVLQALGFHPDAALNHWPLALAVHQTNFPDTAHYCADIHDTDARSVFPGEEIGLLWLSPDCRHFSKAKGGAPVSARVRGLAWVAVSWAKLRRPDVIILENVEEFLTWGPLVPDGKGGLKPDPSRAGQTFRRWVRRLNQAGYVVEWRILSAADYGAPTIRKRLFLVARRDGRPIVWPQPTHAPRKLAAGRGLRPHRAAYEVIDFTRPCPSIFLTRDEARALRVKRPLEEATLRRIAKGLFRYTLAAADPFIVPVTHRGDDRVHDIRDPLRTMTTANRGELALVAAFMEQANTGMVGHDCRDAVSTFLSKGANQRLIAAQLTQFRGSNTGNGGDPREALGVVGAQAGHAAVLAATLDQDLPMQRPFGREHELRAFLVKYYGEAEAADIADPLHSVTSRSRFGLVMVQGVAYRIVDIGMRMLDPESELAAAMGVPKSYVLGFDAAGGRVSKTAITKLVGNMVSPPPAAALIAANCAELFPQAVAA